MLLLISPINHEEALESIKGGADIVDVKPNMQIIFFAHGSISARQDEASQGALPR